MRFGVVHHSLGHDLPLEEVARRVYESGAFVFSTNVTLQNKDSIAELRQRYPMEIIPWWSEPFIRNGPDQPTENFLRLCRELYQPLGISIVMTCSNPDLKTHRWTRDPPLREQLERMAAALKRPCPVAADYGVRIAVENHADYRADDMLELLECIDNPQVGVQLDTANPFTVAEEPVEAARKLAPHVISTHIKDATIRPMTAGEWVKILGTPIGDGDVDIAAIAAILAERAPADIPFTLEIETPPQSDKLRDFQRSVEFVKTRLGHLVDFGPGR